MATTDRPGQVVRALRALDLALERARIDLAEEYRITFTDTLVMSQLLSVRADAPLRPGDLAAQLGLRSGTLTAMLDRLEAAHFLTRVVNPRDRRSTLIELTEGGRDALGDYLHRLASAVQAGVPREAMDAFERQLTDLAAAIETLTRAQSADDD